MNFSEVNFHLASTSMGIAINNIDRLYGTGVDCIDIGSGEFACRYEPASDGLTDHKSNCFQVQRGPPGGHWYEYVCSHDGTFTYDDNPRSNSGHITYNANGRYNDHGNFGVGAGVGHTFGRNNQGEVNLNGNVDDQGNWGVGAGISYTWG